MLKKKKKKKKDLSLKGPKVLLTLKKSIEKKKKDLFSKKIKSTFKDPKILKITKTHF
jgi:hypothetical protein